MTMTVSELREILNDPDLPDDLPIRVQTQLKISTWEWNLDGAHGQLAGRDPHLVLELGAVRLVDDSKEHR